MLRALFVLPIGLTAAAAAAQDPDRSRWGLTGSFAPEWSVPSEFNVLFDADTVSIAGSEFRIGFVRGRMLGGDWGVSYVRKRVDDGSYEESLGDTCFGASCFIVGTRRTAGGIYLNGSRFTTSFLS